MGGTKARDLAVPSDAKSRMDPVPNSPEVIAEAKRIGPTVGAEVKWRVGSMQVDNMEGMGHKH
jgi:hypothetical protein